MGRDKEVSKTLLVLTIAGMIEPVSKAICSLKDELDILIMDDATPEAVGIRKFCKDNNFLFQTKEKPKGLTDSWNRVYQFFKYSNYENCILSNDDVLFPKGFSSGLIEGLKHFDIVAPLSNKPGSGTHQDIKKFIGIKPDEQNINKIQDELLIKFKDDPFLPCKDFNGFCFAFSKSIIRFAFSEDYLSDPKYNFGNEYELANRLKERKGIIALCKASYVWHFKRATVNKFNIKGVNLWNNG